MHYFIALKHEGKYIDGEFIPADAAPDIEGLCKIALRHVLPEFKSRVTAHVIANFDDAEQMHASDIYNGFLSVMDDGRTGFLDLDKLAPAIDAFIKEVIDVHSH